jgi:DnaJ family protein C protein 8
VVLRIRFQGDRDAQLADFLTLEEFRERWKLEGRKFIVDLEWRRRKLTLRIKSEEERVTKEEKEAWGLLRTSTWRLF